MFQGPPLARGKGEIIDPDAVFLGYSRCEGDQDIAKALAVKPGLWPLEDSMKWIALSPLVLVATMVTSPGSAALDPATRKPAEDRHAVQLQRMESPAVHDSLLQGLVTLADMRVIDRPGQHHPFYDSCDTGDGCLSMFPFEDPRLVSGLPTPPLWPLVRNYPGEWSSSIHALTQYIHTPDGQAPITIPDSNMFVTASILYPLAFITEVDRGPLHAMIQDATASIRHYKRGSAYSFWREHPSSTPPYQVIGPLNIPVKLLDILAGSIKSGQKMPEDHGGPTVRPGWVEAILDKSVNPVGLESFFNIPPDADDTALAMIAYRLFPDAQAQEVEALSQVLLDHRDVSRAFEDTRDRWKGHNSGAFLTWLKDESLSIQEAFRPGGGTMPFGVNNVDCVVNANVLFALGLNGHRDDPVVQSTLGVLNRAIDLEAWPYCGLYYPHKMMLPYTLTRAYRDGGLRHPGMNQALGRIVIRLLADQKETKLLDSSRAGAFSGGFDRTYDLSTALAVNALLNIGRDIPRELGLLDDYQRAIEQGIQYLLRSKMLMDAQFPASLGGLYQPGVRAAVWTPGIFFSASVQKAAQWRSEPYTAAIVVEALAKYLLAWDYGSNNIMQVQGLQVAGGELTFAD